MAFLVVCFLLSIYMCYMATPEGASSYMFFEPRALVVANGIVTFSSTHTVEQNFAYCNGDVVGPTILFFLFCCMVCWVDALVLFVHECTSRGRGSSSRLIKTFQYAIVQIAALVPFIGLMVTQTSQMPATIMVSIPKAHEHIHTQRLEKHVHQDCIHYLFLLLTCSHFAGCVHHSHDSEHDHVRCRTAFLKLEEHA